MKKSLFLSLAVCFAASGYAQTAVNQLDKSAMRLPVNKSIRYDKAKDKQQPRKTVTNGFYYTQPGGMYNVGWGIDGRGYGPSVFILPPYQDVKFTDQSHASGNTWSFDFYDTNSHALDESIDVSNYFDGTQFTWSQEPGYFYVTPTMKNGLKSFKLGENSLYLLSDQGGNGYSPRMLTDEGVNWVSEADDHEAYEYNGRIYSNVASWGFMESDNMYGTGTLDDEDESGNIHHLVSVATYLIYSKPLSPLYVESVRIDGESFSQQPLTNGATLTAYVTNVVPTADGQGKEPGDEILYTLTATASDVYGFTESSTRNGKTVYDGSITFTMKQKNAFGLEQVVPFSVDQEFAIYVVGFDNENVDFGIDGLRLDDNNAFVNPSPVIMVEGENVYNYNYQANICAKIYVQAMYDKIEVAVDDFLTNQSPDEHLNVLRADVAGGQFAVENSEVQAAIVGVAMPWYVADEDGNDTEEENYAFNDLPDWITFEGAVPAYDLFDQTGRETPVNYNYYFLVFSAEALPAGVTGRSAVVNIQGRGIEGSAPLTFLQGDATDAIETLQANQSGAASQFTFNIAGQRVNKDYKGIIIKNGKKLVR